MRWGELIGGLLFVGGGVAANGRLRGKFFDAARLNGSKVYFPKKEYCLDNAAMVGCAAHYHPLLPKHDLSPVASLRLV